ncbi:MAG TPA: DUF3578 domain-containing protein [Xanthobacteraceae bacterium]|nr:DUF3578 domain-containing protein [Xanthobacteraceae bacterium]
MRDELLEVIALQREYTYENSPAMQRRGVLIRDLIPQELGAASARLKSALGVHGEDLAFQGRDGTGRKTLIPWVRFFSRSMSPSAQKGWYCVYLFDAPGTGVYLELGHGSTTLIEGEYRPRPPEELAGLVAWGRETLAPVIQSKRALGQPMVLQGQELGDAYERSAVLTKWYSADAMPSDEVLYDDAVEFAGYLKRIYEADALGLSPATPPPEVLEVESVAAGQPERRGTAQGFGLSTVERQAVEMHAMRLAKAHLQSLQWRVRDVSSTRPYDFECTRGSEEMIVEVKGTTSIGEKIVMTRNEVAAHRSHHPHNALIIVHSIDLQRLLPENPKADGGILLMLSPWEIVESQLRPLAFEYTFEPSSPT